ncbi:methyltransferase [Candidatus Woesearchaeota archaeon]|nr:methyltransferase [Candidatus Woesearchaeota archaeon]
MVYEPAEDSFLIQKEVKRLAKGRVLDMGVGSGILAETALKSKRVKSVVGVDIKQEAIDHCKNRLNDKRIKFIVSNLFDKVPKQKFDTIIFNPPYLPEQDGELWELKTDISGGKHGYEIIERFLRQVNNYLQPSGKIILLFSTLTGKQKVESLLLDSMMDFDKLNKLNIAFEQLHVYNVTKSKLRKNLEKRLMSDIWIYAKGHRGLIYTGLIRKKKMAVKVQRPDIDVNESVDNEVKQLRLLTKHGIGPKVLFAGKGYFVYNFIEGDFIMDYFDRKDVKRNHVVSVMVDVFEQMYKLDNLGLNKEEMHHPVKHVIITPKEKAILLDFERCHARKKTHNVTQFAQFLISGRLLPHIERHKMRVSMLDMLARAKKYAHRRTRENFENILELIR